MNILNSNVTTHARAPKQDRSRVSFERALNTAAQLLAEKGYAEFTLSELSRRSRVSVGSIYCRVKSKDDLLRQVQARTLQRYELEFAGLVNRLRRQSLPLEELVPAAVRELGEFLRGHAAILSAFMDLANTDRVVSAAGKQAFTQNMVDFRLLLLERRDEIRRPDVELAADICFQVVYASLARFLGLGSTLDATLTGDWNQLLDNLGLMALAFLRSPQRVGGPPSTRK